MLSIRVDRFLIINYTALHFSRRPRQSKSTFFGIPRVLPLLLIAQQ